MRLLISLLCLLFFSCKTPQFNTDYTIDYSDIKVVMDCDIYMHKSKITNKPLNGLYRVVSNRKHYSITKFKNGIVQSKKFYGKNKLLQRSEQLNSDTSIYIEYYSKKRLSFWNDSKPYDSIHAYYKKYPTQINLFYKGDTCKYTFEYNSLIGRLKIVTKGCKLEYIPSELKSAVLNTKCRNNPLTYNTEDRVFNKEITVEIINNQDTIYNYFELNEDRYVQQF